ncbi:unnamed protein product [Moneuplotes crassus]|uniref:DUSP domain-containing protein n=1 Tax=Euplotes crassus TaxID=5936 RepID=A0AAD1XF11_EUPCR|nr:unnamed protein product [Moneuplotes crassus]
MEQHKDSVMDGSEIDTLEADKHFDEGLNLPIAKSQIEFSTNSLYGKEHRRRQPPNEMRVIKDILAVQSKTVSKIKNSYKMEDFDKNVYYLISSEWMKSWRNVKNSGSYHLPEASFSNKPLSKKDKINIR